MANTEPLVYYIRKRQLGFLGHILRLPEEEPTRRYAFYVPPHGKRKPGRPRTSYNKYIQRVLGCHEVDISADEIDEIFINLSSQHRSTNNSLEMPTNTHIILDQSVLEPTPCFSSECAID